MVLKPHLFVNYSKHLHLRFTAAVSTGGAVLDGDVVIVESTGLPVPADVVVSSVADSGCVEPTVADPAIERCVTSVC